MLFNVTYFVAVGHNNIRLVQSQEALLEVEGRQEVEWMELVSAITQEAATQPAGPQVRFIRSPPF